MNKTLKVILKYLILFCIGGTGYYSFECVFRLITKGEAYSHWTMAILGGFCFVLIGGINEFLTYEMPLWKQCLIGSVVITILEFICGCIVNIWLGWNVWDYSDMPFSVLDQICLPFSLLWFVMSGVVIITDDWLRYWLFKEEKPHYKLK